MFNLNGLNRLRIVAWFFLSAAALLGFAQSASARDSILPAIRVRGFAGLSGYLYPDQDWILVDKAAPVIATWWSNDFAMSYANNAFRFTALNDNSIAQGEDGPWGILLFPPTGPTIPSYGSLGASTQLGFLGWPDFPGKAGDSVFIPVLPEPEEALLVGFGILTILALNRRRGPGA